MLIEDKNQKDKKMAIPTMVSIEEEYSNSYDLDFSESINYFKK